MSGGIGADFSRTCAGCDQLVEEERIKDKIAYRCFAPGRCKGFVVGVERLNPYVPAWCPKLIEEAQKWKM